MTLKWSSSYALVDAEVDKVSLLLHGDGTNGSTTIVDSSSNVNSVTANNGAQISTTQSKFGGSSIEFLSTANTGLAVTPSSVFQFGTGDWTVEAWIYQRGQVPYSTLYEIGNHANAGSMLISVGSNGFLAYSGGFFGPQTNTFTLNTWQHTAVTRAGNLLYFFLNGTIVGNGGGYSFTNNLYINSTVSVAYPYGYQPTAALADYRFNGYIDDLRVTKGVARYTANFTPPTAPFPPDLGPPIPQHIILQSPASNDPLLDLNTQPSLDLQFATSKTLDDRVSGLPLVNHQRDASSGKSAGTYVGSDGLIKTSPVNLLTYSEDFSPSWFAGTATVSAAPSVLSPTGTANTKELSVGTRYASLSDVTAGNQYTFSIYVRSAGLSTQFALTAQGGFTGDRSTIFNIIDGTLVSSGSGVDNYSITSFPNGWYRVSQTDTAETSSSTTWQVESVNSSAYIWGAQLEENSTASTYIPTTSTISGAPRFDHDPVTGESLGLLIEESRTNQFPYSTDFTTTSWTRPNTTVTPNVTTAPDGVPSTADRIQIGAANGFISNNTVGAVTSNSTISVWIKAVNPGTDNVFRLISAGDLSEDLAATNEWVRYTFTSSTTTQSLHGIARPSDNTAADIYVWGAQFEENNIFPTSYIPTTTSAVTRAAELCSILGTNYTSVFGATLGSGSIFADVKVLGEKGNTSTGAFSSFGTSSNSQFTTFTRYDNRLNVGFTVPGANIAQYKDLTGVRVKSAVSWTDLEQPVNDQANASHVLDGVSYGGNLYFKSGNALNTDYDRFGIGRSIRSITASGSINGHISRLTYYPYRLADATLQEITS